MTLESNGMMQWPVLGAAVGWMFVHGLVRAVNESDSDLVWLDALGTLLAVALCGSLWQARQQRRIAQAKVVGDRLLGLAPALQTMAGIQRLSALEALMERLMPHSFHPSDPAETRTCLRIDIHVRLALADRLRLLLTGDLRVLATTYTNVEVKQARTLANIEVHPFTVKE